MASATPGDACSLRAASPQNRADDTSALQPYTLDRLLTIFQNVADALAFAHSKGIIGAVLGKQVNDTGPHELEVTLRLDGANATTPDGQPLYKWTGPSATLSQYKAQGVGHHRARCPRPRHLRRRLGGVGGEGEAAGGGEVGPEKPPACHFRPGMARFPGKRPSPDEMGAPPRQMGAPPFRAVSSLSGTLFTPPRGSLIPG